LTVFRPCYIFFTGHDFGALVGLAQTLEGDVVHFFFFLVLFIVALGDLDCKKGRGFPGETDFGLFILLGRFVYGAARNDTADGIVTGSDVCICAFVVGVLDVFADVFPGEKCAEARYFGLIMAYLEDEVVGADRFGATTSGELSAIA
jgi:hypothetical protein